MKIIVVGDAFIRAGLFAQNCEEFLAEFKPEVIQLHFGGDSEVDLDERARNLEINGPEAEEPPPELFEHIEDADMLLGHYVPISRRVIESGKKLQIVGVSRGGYENLDLAAATECGVLAFHVIGRTTGAVSDFTIGMIISECRNIARAHHAIVSGQWRKEFLNTSTTPELAGRTVGLLGFGEVGRDVSKKLSGFDVRIIAHDPFVQEASMIAAGVEPVGMDTLLRDSDFLSLHARLTPDSEKIIGAKELSLLKPTAYLINTARSGLIDTDALIEVLRENRISGAALDVFEDEPLPSDSEFLVLDNVTLTSHLAYATIDCLEKSPRLLVQDIHHKLCGQDSKFMLNPEVLRKKQG